MQSGKSPEPGGYLTDFYNTFSDQLAHLLLSLFEESLSLKTLSLTMHLAVLSVIFKKGENPIECNFFFFAHFLSLTLMQKSPQKFWHVNWSMFFLPLFHWTKKDFPIVTPFSMLDAFIAPLHQVCPR